MRLTHIDSGTQVSSVDGYESILEAPPSRPRPAPRQEPAAPPAPSIPSMPYDEAEARRAELAERLGAARLALERAQLELAQAEQMHREAVVNGAPTDQDAIEAAERAARRAQRDCESLELAAAAHWPTWAQAKSRSLHAEAGTFRDQARTHQVAMNTIAEQIAALQRESAGHAEQLKALTHEGQQRDSQADDLAREAVARRR